ncbi:PIN domain-containing protein [Novosphingopyxis sp.]|uniref:PIN domain-containing protein n=1 Tax=Novosphingopyxis sp. TaxID=2709690 RepID=UPI003B5B890D
MILVDTNVWSEASKPNGRAEVLHWLEENRHDLWLSAVVIAEIRAGIENPEASEKREGLEWWLAKLERANADRTLSFDRTAAYALGKLLVKKPQEAKMLDMLLAAQALSRECPIATRNVRDFAWTGVRSIDPWSDGK